MNPDFAVPSGSNGDSHAIVKQLHMIVVRMSGSNHDDSMVSMHSRRGCIAGLKQHRDLLR